VVLPGSGQPGYYNHYLLNAVSLLGKGHPIKPIPDNIISRYNCFTNVVYLMHELRSRYLQLEPKEQQGFALHLLKRAKHLVRNAIYVLSGYSHEEIHLASAVNMFPQEEPDFFIFLNEVKKTWGVYCK